MKYIIIALGVLCGCTKSISLHNKSGDTPGTISFSCSCGGGLYYTRETDYLPDTSTILYFTDTIKPPKYPIVGWETPNARCSGCDSTKGINWERYIPDSTKYRASDFIIRRAVPSMNIYEGDNTGIGQRKLKKEKQFVIVAGESSGCGEPLDFTLRVNDTVFVFKSPKKCGHKWH